MDRNQLIEQNLKLVGFVVQRYCRKYLAYSDMEDMVGAGNIGLVKAAQYFKPEYGAKFSTYAVPMIYGEIQRHVRDCCGHIHCSRRIKDLSFKINRLNLINAPAAVIARKLRVPITDVDLALDYNQKAVVKSLSDIAANNRNNNTFLIEDTVGFYDSQDGLLIEDIVGCLDEREGQVFRLYYLQDYSQTEIAAILRISQAQVSRLIIRIRDKVKKLLARDNLPAAQ